MARTRLGWRIGGLALLLGCGPAGAAEMMHAITPDETAIGFEVDLLGILPASGSFGRFSGSLAFDPAAPDGGPVAVRLEVEAASVSMGWEPAQGMLLSQDYLDPGHFDRLRFTAHTAQSVGPDHLRLEGTLTLRGVTLPQALDVSLGESRWDSGHHNKVTDVEVSGRISRSAFGMTADPDLVSDEVRLRLTTRIVLPEQVAALAGN
jgi:polyisoprenoid-binding protein YceI